MTVTCKGQLIDLSFPKVMGILNNTPDSFYDGGLYNHPATVLEKVAVMLAEGATFIDIGGYSSRPNAPHISEDEELQRVLPVLELLLKEFPEALFSVDTFRSTIADECLHRGAALINDISGGNLDAQMRATIAKHKVPFVLMHMKGTPQTMQQHAVYTDIIQDLLHYFSEKVALARQAGINDVIIDPGFGFAKTIAQNFEVLSNLDAFHALELPILVGLSRKSTIYKTLGATPKEALNGTSVLHTLALDRGAHILRAHDVREAIECIRLVDAFKGRTL
ncbi:dihydropteroate synthase [Arenibacter sp. GZD96]|uniref:dihydropteroate synthase n=1 Tax=Aurantibrevibacter litoralis TaxID=3106030 RepID=UPI002AFE9DBF|nr:dihydropteroate synthase [Arenibacter sp. GZD-96]MEA1784664.1 dihydropteroate synthase [Arenibacter sp. GZD-96]